MNIFLPIKMSYCKLNHTWDEVVSEDGIRADVLINNIKNRENISSTNRVSEFLSIDQNSKLKILLDGKTDSEIVQFIEKYARWKKMIQGDNTPIQFMDVLKFSDQTMEDKITTMLRYGQNFRIDFEKEKDILYGILYVFNKTNPDQLSTESKDFLKIVIDVFNKNPNLLDESIKKQIFEFQLKDLKNGELFNNVNNTSFFIKDSDLASNYPTQYRFYEERKIVSDRINLNPDSNIVERPIETIKNYRELLKNNQNQTLKNSINSTLVSDNLEKVDDLSIKELKILDDSYLNLDETLEITITKILLSKLDTSDTNLRIKSILNDWYQTGRLTESNLTELIQIFEFTDNLDNLTLIHLIQNSIIDQIERIYLGIPPNVLDESLTAIRTGDLEKLLNDTDDQLIALIPILETDAIMLNPTNPSYVIKIGKAEEDKFTKFQKFIQNDNSYVIRDVQQNLDITNSIQLNTQSVLNGNLTVEQLIKTDFYKSLDEFEKLKLYESIRTAIINQYQDFSKIDPMFYRSSSQLDILENLYQSSIDFLELNTETRKNIRRSLVELQEYRDLLKEENLAKKLEKLKDFNPSFVPVSKTVDVTKIENGSQVFVNQIQSKLEKIYDNITNLNETTKEVFNSFKKKALFLNESNIPYRSSFENFVFIDEFSFLRNSDGTLPSNIKFTLDYDPTTELYIDPADLLELKNLMEQFQNQYLTLKTMPTSVSTAIDEVNQSLQTMFTKVLTSQNNYIDTIPLPSKSNDLLNILNSLQSKTDQPIYQDLIDNLINYHRELFRSGLNADSTFFESFDLQSLLDLMTLKENVGDIRAFKQLYEDWYTSMFGEARLVTINDFIFSPSFEYQKFMTPELVMAFSYEINNKISFISQSQNISEFYKSFILEQLEEMKKSIMIRIQGTEMLTKESLNLDKINIGSIPFIKEMMNADPILKEKYMTWEIAKKIRDNPKLKEVFLEAQNLKQARNSVAFQVIPFTENIPNSQIINQVMEQEYQIFLNNELAKIIPSVEGNTQAIQTINTDILKIDQDVSKKAITDLEDSKVDSLLQDELIDITTTVSNATTKRQNLTEIFDTTKSSIPRLNLEFQNFQIEMNVDHFQKWNQINTKILDYDLPTIDWTKTDIQLRQEMDEIVSELGYPSNNVSFETSTKQELREAYKVLENYYIQLSNRSDLHLIQYNLANNSEVNQSFSNLLYSARSENGMDGRYLQFRLNTDIRKGNIQTSIQYLKNFDEAQTWEQLLTSNPMIQFIQNSLDGYVLEGIESKKISQIITELSNLNNELKMLEKVSQDLSLSGIYKLNTNKIPDQLIHQTWFETKIPTVISDLKYVEDKIKDSVYDPLVSSLRTVYTNLNLQIPQDFNSQITSILKKITNRPFYITDTDLFFKAEYLEAKYFSGKKVFQRRLYSSNTDRLVLDQEIDRLLSLQLGQIEDLTLLENISEYHTLVSNSPVVIQTSEQVARQDLLKYIYIYSNQNAGYKQKVEKSIQKINKYQSNRILLTQGTFSSRQTNEYSKVIRRFFQYAPVTSGNYVVYKKYIDTILQQALKHNRLKELENFIELANPTLFNLMKERAETYLKLNLQTENVKAFQLTMSKLENQVKQKLQFASSMVDMLNIASVYRQPQRFHYMIDKLRFGTPHYTRELLAMSGIYFNIPVSGIMMGRFGSWSTIVDIFTFLGITSPRFNRISSVIGYFDRLRSIIQGYTFKGLGNSTRYIPKNIFDSYAYSFTIEPKETLINIEEWMSILSKFYNNQEISIDEWSQLIFVHYKQNEIPLLEDNYCNNFIQDLEIYSPDIYLALDISNNYTIFKNRFCQNFLDIKNTLSSIDLREHFEYQNEIATLNNIILPDQLNFNIPYNLIIEQLGRYARYDWNAYLDIEPLMRYDNFSMENYYLTLFLRKDLSQLQKILILLKSCYLSNFKDTFLTFIQTKYQNITQTDASKNYLSNSSISTRIEKDILTLIISPTFTLTIIPILYNIYIQQSNQLTDFIDALLYYYLHTEFILQDSIGNKLFTYIKNTLNNYGLVIDLSGVDIDEILNNHPIYLINKYNSKQDEFLGKYNSISENVIHVDHNIITPVQVDLDELMEMIFAPKENLDFIDLLSDYENLMYSLNLDLKAWATKVIQHPNISSGKKFLFLCYIKCPYLSILKDLYGVEIANFLFYQIPSSNIYEKIYQLFVQNVIDNFGLISFLLSYSTFENIPFENIGKKSMFDIVSNINMDIKKYLDLFRLKIYQVHPNLYQVLSPNNSLWEALILKNRFFKDQYLDLEVDRMHHLSQLQSKQIVYDRNANSFISIYISKNIKDPLDLLLFLERYIFEDGVLDKIKNNLKELNYLNKFFYKNWIENQKIGEIYSIQTPILLSKLLNLKILNEDEFFDVLEIVSNYNVLLNAISYEYEFSKPIQEYKFYPKIASQTTQIQTKGFKPTQSNNFIDKRPEDLNSLLSKVKENIPLYNKMSIYHKKVMNGERFDENELFSQIFSDLSGSVVESSSNNLSDEELEELVDQKNFQKIDDYLMYINKNNAQEIVNMISSVNSRVIATQTILSMFDPTQVLVDYLFDDLVQNGIIPNEIKNRNLPMKVSSFPSFYMAYQIMFYLGGRWVSKNQSTINLQDLILTKLKSQDANFLSDLRKDYENIMNNEDEKYKMIKTTFWQTIMYVKFIHNENPIAFNADLSVNNNSKYTITMNESAKMKVQKGGDGMVKLEKF
jgi:hypothetical protein